MSGTLPGLSRPLTTTEAALIDLEGQERAIADRRRMLTGDPAVPLTAADQARKDPWDQETLEAMTRPVRIEIAFSDPIKVREQIDALIPMLQEARVATYDHSAGLARQLLRLRHIVKVGADVICYMNGKAPSGRRKKGDR